MIHFVLSFFVWLFDLLATIIFLLLLVRVIFFYLPFNFWFVRWSERCSDWAVRPVRGRLPLQKPDFAALLLALILSYVAVGIISPGMFQVAAFFR